MKRSPRRIVVSPGTGLLGRTLFGAAFFLLARVASACPVCFAAKNEANRAAFVDMTVFMTLLPLVMLGACIAWFLRKTRELEGARDDKETREAAPRRGVAAWFRHRLLPFGSSPR